MHQHERNLGILLRPRGNLGNQMFQYMLASRLGRMVGSADIYGADIPVWGIRPTALPDGWRTPFRVSDKFIDTDAIARLGRGGIIDRIELRGLGLRMEHLAPAAEASRLFRAPDVGTSGFGPDCVVINVRGAEILKNTHPDYGPVPLSYFDAVIENSGAEPVFLGQLADDFYSDMIRKRYPKARFVPSAGPLADFETLRRSSQISVSVSTFSWLAAWMSSATRIHLPVAGFLHPRQRPAIDLLPEADDRYVFYECAPRQWTASQDDIDALAVPRSHELLGSAEIGALKREADERTGWARAGRRAQFYLRAYLNRVRGLTRGGE